MPDDDGTVRRKSLSEYYNASQLRIDNWNRLKTLVRRQLEGRGQANDKDRARAILERLAPIEMYWAFPGPQAVEGLERAINAGDFKL